VDIYSAFIVVLHTSAQVPITQFYLQITPYLPLPRKRSPDGGSPDRGCGHLIAVYYSFIYPEESAWWLTYSGRFTHISVHPSVAGREDKESLPVKDRRSVTVPRNQPTSTKLNSTQLKCSELANSVGLCWAIDMSQLNRLRRIGCSAQLYKIPRLQNGPDFSVLSNCSWLSCVT